MTARVLLFSPLAPRHEAEDARHWHGAAHETGRWWAVLWGEIVQLVGDILRCSTPPG